MQNHVDPHLLQLLWQGLQAIQNNTPIDKQYESYPEPLQPLFWAQQDISWDQLYYSQISIQWAQHLTRSSQYKINGDVFYSQVIGIIWGYIFDCWKQQNTHLHSPDMVPLDFPVHAEQVHLLIDTANLDPALTHIAPTQTVEQILQRPIPRTKNLWLGTASTVPNTCRTTSQQHTNVLYYTPMTLETSSNPSRKMICHHHNQLHYINHAGLLIYYGSP